MTFLDLLSEKGLSIYWLSRLSGVPKTTIHDISTSKSALLNCSGKTLLALSSALNVSIEYLLKLDREEKYNLPPFLQQSINSLRKAIRSKSHFLDCCLDELASSINVVEVEGMIISDVTNKLRKHYL